MKIDKLINKIKRNKIYAINGTGLMVAFAAEVLYAKIFGTDVFGSFVLVKTVLIMITSVCGLGVIASAPRYIAIYIGENRPDKVRGFIHFYYKFFIAVIIGTMIVTMLIAMLSSSVFKNFENINLYLYVSILTVPSMLLLRLSASVLKGFGKNELQTFFQTFLLNFTLVTVLFICWFIQPTAMSIIIGYSISYLITAAVSCFFLISEVRKYLHGSTGSVSVDKKELFIHSFPMLVTAFANKFLRKADIIVIGMLFDEKHVAVYRLALALLEGFKKISQPINDIALYIMSIEKGQKKNPYSSYVDTLKKNFLMLAPFYIAAVVFSSQIEGYAGGKYIGLAKIIVVLTPGFLAFITIGPAGQFFNVAGANFKRMFIVIIFGTINIISLYLFGYFWGFDFIPYVTTINMILFSLCIHIIIKNIARTFNETIEPQNSI